MDKEIRERFDAAYRAIVEMNRATWERWPRRKTQAEANQEALDALDALARNGYDLVPDNEGLARLKTKDYAGIGSQPGDLDGVKEPPKAATPELQRRYDAAGRLARRITRQSWLDYEMTDAEFEETELCSEAWHLIDAYGYQGVLPEKEERAPKPRRAVRVKALAQN